MKYLGKITDPKDLVTKEYVDGKVGGIPTQGQMGQAYGGTTTAQSTATKVVETVGGDYELVEGGIVVVEFQYAVNANAKLNVDGAGAKSIYYNGVTITAGVILAGDTCTFMYSENVYVLLSIVRTATSASSSSKKIITGRTSQFTATSSSTTTAVANHSGFSSTPKVVGTLYGVSSTTNQLVLMITSQTATSTTFTIRNNGTADRKGYVDWIAIGE